MGGDCSRFPMMCILPPIVGVFAAIILITVCLLFKFGILRNRRIRIGTTRTGNLVAYPAGVLPVHPHCAPYYAAPGMTVSDPGYGQQMAMPPPQNAGNLASLPGVPQTGGVPQHQQGNLQQQQGIPPSQHGIPPAQHSISQSQQGNPPFQQANPPFQQASSHSDQASPFEPTAPPNNQGVTYTDEDTLKSLPPPPPYDPNKY